MKKKVDRTKNIILILSIVAISLAASIAVMNTAVIFDVLEVRMDVKVIDEPLAGFNIDTDALHFGKVQKGGEMIRNITLTNSDSKPHLIFIKAYGNISGFVYVSENGFVMQPDTTKNLSVSAKPDTSAGTGYYDGTLRVMFLNT